MLNKVKAAISDFNLLSGATTVAVALSGGADSVALLCAMLEISDEFNIRILAAHFNHLLRGSEADRDERFVRKLCEEKGVKLIVGSGDVSDFAKKNKISTELAARQMRYDFFSKLPADLVATAHTASDNLETVIFNLTRGSALDGLCGIPPKRDRYIRPLILCTRKDIEDYCNKNNLSYVTDSTNLSDDCSRNIIRHKIVPVLKEINPAVEKNITNTALNLAVDRDELQGIAKSEYKKLVTEKGLDVRNLTGLGMAISVRVLRLFCTDKTGVVPDRFHTDDLFRVAFGGGRCSLEGGYTAERQKGILKIFSLDDIVYDVRIDKVKNDLIKKDKKVNSLLLKNVLDCDRITGELTVRTRNEGDKIRLAGRGCTKTLKSLYNENGIPANMRRNLPVIADDLGVVWVAEIGVSDRAAADLNSNFIYKISYETVSGGNNTK